MAFPYTVIVFFASLVLLLSTSFAIPTGSITAAKRDLRFGFGAQKIRGVNLGGWLLLEPWITPSIFEGTPGNVVDEYTFCETLGPTEAENRLAAHWGGFITEQDFGDIAAKGLNFVRIPIGYWAVAPIDGEPYVQGAYDYLGSALDWAQSAGIKVLIDLHGAPGSQNGLDNSGKRGDILWGSGDTVAQTIKALSKIRDDHANHPAVAAIELLNEPMGPKLDMNMVRDFMGQGYETLKGSSVAIPFHDAFQGPSAWNDWGAGMENIMVDTHHYEVFDSGQLQMTIDQHVSSACGFGGEMSGSAHWTIAGEWSGALTDCAKWLNGRDVGARYDGTFNFNGQGSSYIGSCDGKSSSSVAELSPADRDNIKRFIGAQLAAYEKADGWIFWTWKNEAAPEWHFKDLADAGIIPQPLDSMDGSACG